MERMYNFSVSLMFNYQFMESYLLFIAAMKMLNPVALFRSASSRSSSSRFLISSSAMKDESGYDSSSGDVSEESSSFSPSHQSTLDRLYAWEKKLYQEVRVCSSNLLLH